MKKAKESGKFKAITFWLTKNFAQKNISDKQPLIFQGSNKFKNVAFKTAVENEMELKFADENFQRTFFVMKARKKFEERKFVEGNGKIFSLAPLSNPTLKNFCWAMNWLVSRLKRKNNSVRFNFFAEQLNLPE